MIMPCCGIEADDATPCGPGADRAPSPKPGDAGVCFECGTWIIYAPEHTARLFGPDDLLIFSDDQLHLLRRVTRHVRQWRRSR